MKANYEQTAPIPSFTYSDREELNKLIWALKENYAESIPEARRWLKAEEDNKKRQAEEAAAAAEQQEAEKAAKTDKKAK